MEPRAIINLGNGILAYDTLMLRYEYHKTSEENKIDSVRYIITDLVNNKRDSAFVIFDIGCQTNVQPMLLRCQTDTVIPSEEGTCNASFEIKAPTLSETPISSPNFYSDYASSGVGDIVNLTVGESEKIITFFQNGINSFCETHVEVKETPKVICPENITSCTPKITWEEPSAQIICPKTENITFTQQEPFLSSGSFFPEGITTINYIISNPFGTDSTCSFDIEIIDEGEASWKEGVSSMTVCSSTEDIDLKKLLEGDLTGSWSENSLEGVFITDSIYLNPLQIIDYTLSEESSLSSLVCSTSIQFNITIDNSSSLPSINKIDSNVCYYSKNLNLDSLYNTNFSQGNWSVAESQTNIFKASVLGKGEHSVTFTNKSSICPESFSQSLIVNAPLETNAEITLCEDTLFIDLPKSEIDSIITTTLNWESNIKELVVLGAKGSHNLKIIDYDEKLSCTSVKNYTIEISETPTISWKGNNNSSTCNNGALIQFSDSLIYNNSLTAAWSNNTQNSLFNPINSLFGTTEKITATISNNFCFDTISYFLSIEDSIDLGLEIDQMICPYQKKINLKTSLNTNNSGVWTIDNFLTDTIKPSELKYGEHEIVYQIFDDICPYKFTQTIEIDSGDNYLSSNFEFCNNEGIITFDFDEKDSIIPITDINYVKTTDGISVNNTLYGNHNLKKITFSDNKCLVINNYDISFHELPTTAEAGEDIDLNYDDNTFSLNANTPEIGSGKWIYNPINIEITDHTSEVSDGLFKSGNTTSLIWETSNGNCPKSTDTILIHKSELRIAEAFTPNGDNINDYFEILGAENFKVKVEIMNRWGQIVYTNLDYKNEWSGTSTSGKDLISDTYYYLITIEGKEDFKGKVFIKR